MHTKHLLATILIFPFSLWATGSGSDWAATSALQFQQQSDTRVTVGDNIISFFTGATERMTLDANGNVGIGTTTPGARLQISGGDLLLQNPTSGYPALWLKDVTGSNTLKLDYNSLIGAGDNLIIRSGVSNALVLNDDGGNVGIGTTDPQYAKLQVRGGATHELFAVNRPDSDVPALYLGNDGTTNAAIASNNSDLTFGRDFGGTYTEYMRLQNSSGNVGIGTTTPEMKLEVNGDIMLRNSTGPKQIYTWSPTDSNWRIGMNLTPGFTRSLATNHVQFLTYAPGVGQGFAVGVNGGNSSFEIQGSDHKAYFRGNVGIGTSGPAAKLHIEDASVKLNSTDSKDANLIIHGASNSRSMSEGAALGFIVPANTDGSNPWQQGRILVAPDNESNGNAHGRMYLQTRYLSSQAWEWRNNLVLTSNGNVGIGTTSPSHKLHVAGNIHGATFSADAPPSWPDYVFEDTYELNKLEQVEKYIEKNHHLPEIPSAAEVQENGVDIVSMQAKLLQKIEELTLYVIEQNKQLTQQNKRIDVQQDEIQKLKSQIKK